VRRSSPRSSYITKAEGDALKQRVRSGDVPAVPPSFRRPAFGPRPAPAAPARSDLMETAADYLGMDKAGVREALRDGKSLADLARERSKSVDGLKQALVGATREDADRAVEDGVLTKEQAGRLVEKLSRAVDELVEGKLNRGFGFEFHDGGGRFEFHFRVEPDAMHS
jgi:hypothetical protein